MITPWDHKKNTEKIEQLANHIWRLEKKIDMMMQYLNIEMAGPEAKMVKIRKSKRRRSNEVHSL